MVFDIVVIFQIIYYHWKSEVKLCLFLNILKHDEIL